MKRLILLFIAACAMLLEGCASMDDSGGIEFLPGYARALAWSPDASVIVAVGQNELLVHDATTLEVVTRRKLSDIRLAITQPPAAIAFSPDGKSAATAVDGRVTLWDVAGWTPRLVLKDESQLDSTTVAFTPDGSKLFVGGPRSALSLYDAGSGRLESTLAPAPSGVIVLALSPDGRMLASGEATRRVRIWDIGAPEAQTVIADYSAPVLAVAFSSDARLLASFAGGREARVLDLGDRRKTLLLLDPQEITPQEQTAAGIASILSLVSAARTAQITGAPAPATVGQPQGGPTINCPLAFSPDGTSLALIRLSFELSSSYHVEVYDVASGARVSRNNSGISSLAFSPDGTRLAVSGIVRIILLDPKTGTEVKPAR